MTAVLCNKCSPFPPSSCSVRRRRAAVARHPSPPALSSRPPVRPAGNAVLPEIIVQFPLIHDTDLPHSTPKSSVASTGPSPSPGLYTKKHFFDDAVPGRWCPLTTLHFVSTSHIQHFQRSTHGPRGQLFDLFFTSTDLVEHGPIIHRFRRLPATTMMGWVNHEGPGGGHSSSQHKPRSSRSHCRNMFYISPVPPLPARRPQVIRILCRITCVPGRRRKTRVPQQMIPPCFRLIQGQHAFPVTLWGHAMIDMVCGLLRAGKVCTKIIILYSFIIAMCPKLLYVVAFAMCQTYYILSYLPCAQNYYILSHLPCAKLIMFYIFTILLFVILNIILKLSI